MKFNINKIIIVYFTASSTYQYDEKDEARGWTDGLVPYNNAQTLTATRHSRRTPHPAL